MRLGLTAGVCASCLWAMPCGAEIMPPSKSAIAAEVPEIAPAVAPPAPTVVESNPTPVVAPPTVIVVEADQAPQPTTAPRMDQPEIILESRASGCRANAQELAQRPGNLCRPTTTMTDYAVPNLAVRRLSQAEIREIVAKSSLPNNGDRQMLFPLAVPAVISSAFGWRIHPVDGVERFHYGTDIAAPEGTPVVAVYGGRVEIAGWLGGMGWAVVISHGDRLETRYGHLSQILVKPGEEIEQGRVIGLVGSSGVATGAHLHFEMWQRSLNDAWLAIDSTPHVLLALDHLRQYLASADLMQSWVASVK